MCRRILYGEHLQDVNARIAVQIPDVRQSAWGRPDMGSNPFKAVWSVLSTLYDRGPSVSLGTSDGLIVPAQDLAKRAAGQGLWSLMSRVQRDTLALREMWMRVSVAPRDGAPGQFDPVYEPAYPDVVHAEASGDRPGVPHAIWHARLRETSDGVEWMWDHVSVEDPEHPVYRIVRAHGDKLVDVSSAYPDSGAGSWPDVWRDRQGRPVLPYVLYHAAQTPYLYDPYQTRELVEGTLNLAVLRTYVAHVARSAAWRQRYTIDCYLTGAEAVAEGDDGKTRTRVVLDPATIAAFNRSSDEANPQVGTFDLPAVPSELWEYIEGYERKLIAEAGINPADQMAMKGDPRSGFALAVSRDSQREAKRRFEPQFQRCDQELLRVTAVQLNRAEGRSYPEFGYRVTYKGVPQSAPERAALRAHLLELMSAGLLDPVSAYQELHPGVTDPEALSALRAIGTVKEQIAADTGGGTGDVQAQALNGAQATALANLAAQVALGQLPAGAAKAVAAVSFPGVPSVLLDSIFTGLDSFEPRPEAAAENEAAEPGVSDGRQV